MCTIVYINRDGVCWRLDWRKRHSKRVKRLAIGRLLANVWMIFAWVGGKILHPIIAIYSKQGTQGIF